jgi:hypothetical protein
MSTYAASTTIRAHSTTQVHVIPNSRYDRTELIIERRRGEISSALLTCSQVAELIAALTDAHNQRASRPT